MTTNLLHKFVEYLAQQNIVWAPQRENDQLVVSQVSDPKNIELSAEIPLHSFKKILVPPKEVLFNYKKDQIKPDVRTPYQVIFGLTIVDLKAITLLNQVFRKDANFQERMKKTLVIGHNLLPKDHPDYMGKFEENILEHLKFDIFLMVKGNKFDVYTGSEDGQRTLDDFGYKSYEHIEFVGSIKEKGPEPDLIKLRENFYNDPKIWQELGEKCIECGKCSLICPTCFCFNMKDENELEKDTGRKSRAWASCFYTDFSEVAGIEINGKKPKFIKTTADRIRFWYEHKFVRIPDEFSISGCVKCGRCAKVCPVGIDIREIKKKILKSSKQDKQ